MRYSAYRTFFSSMQFFISCSRFVSLLVPVFTSIKTTSFISPSEAPLKATKSTGFPTKRQSDGLQGKSGKNGATCSAARPERTAFERFTASARSVFKRRRNFNSAEILPVAQAIKTVKMNIIIPKIWMFAGSCKNISSKFFMQTIVAYFRAKDAARPGGAQGAWVPP